jgi:hypothetical protein
MENTEIDLENLTHEKASFIFEQAKEYLSKTIDVSDKIDQKAFTILGFSVVVMNGIIAYVFLQYQSLQCILLFPILLYLIAVIASNILLTLTIHPREWHMTGNSPESFLKNIVLKQDIKLIIIGEAQNYIERAKLNTKQNTIKAMYLKTALSIIVFSPFAIFLLYFLTKSMLLW